MRSAQNICAVATLVIHEGQQEGFRAVAEELSEATAKESGAGNPDDQVSQAFSEATSNVARFHRPYAGFVR